MIRRMGIAVVLLATFVMTPLCHSAPINLLSWSELTLDFPGGQPAGDWILGGGNTIVTQVVNADPSFYLNNVNQTQYSMDGTWQVMNGGDDDYMGFVFGYQNSSNFYLFDWKRGSQSYAGQHATEGMTLKMMTGATGDGLTDLSLAEFWENDTDFGDMTILAANHGSTTGWSPNTEYQFHLDFNLNPGEISIEVKQGATSLWDVTVNDTTFNTGQFGFYNFSQEDVKYAGFEQTGGVITDPEVPEPAACVIWMLLGFTAFGIRRHWCSRHR
jgi:hypothetical protein